MYTSIYSPFPECRRRQVLSRHLCVPDEEKLPSVGSSDICYYFESRAKIFNPIGNFQEDTHTHIYIFNQVRLNDRSSCNNSISER
ncbi:hypothetical protein K504DRAFT_56222 [Pleomassaria siparia CBS 279.74]|uniref:Uncharacterized protein n=1 Tax=Pleomassaria siparia CBS 279.74 TaxID=1314801 RepID=A0A6G1K3R3_9PLEO|nr:hypothetical protein K504DRAFT_56222 [Pleomassaria siparia CBS 279.74]